MWKRAYFCTFTFRKAPRTEAFAYEVFKKYLKRVRKDGLKFKYVAATEKGDKFGRVHVHANFFADENVTVNKLRKYWKHGNSHGAVFTPKTAAYVAKYLVKGSKPRSSQGVGMTVVHKLKESSMLQEVLEQFGDIEIVKINGRIPAHLSRKVTYVQQQSEEIEEWRKTPTERWRLRQ
jgi:hypothetical protein